MKAINSEELKSLQLNILKVISDFCHLNNLKYSLAFGTLLGAVRHSGYIPWDDDIDIMMPRKDYDIFINSFSNDKYRILYFPKYKDYFLPFAKVIDTRTILKEDTILKYNLGVNIDVFPIDNCPYIEDEKKWFRKKSFINNLYAIKKITLSKNRSLLKNFIILVARLILVPLSLSKLCKIIQNMAVQYASINTGRKGILITENTNLKWMLPAEVFDSYKEISFEENDFMSIADTHTYLKATYGNYMKLPPEEKRITHHAFEAYWK